MEGVNCAVVRGNADALARSQAVKDYAPDIEITFDGPVSDPQAATEGSPTDETFYPLQWDKQV
jgi:hypothetical protein